MAERGELIRYAYWSERRVKALTDDLEIDIEPRWKTKITAFKIPFTSTSLDLERPPRTLHRREIAARIERAVGDHAVEDFVTPPKVRFAKGTGTVQFSHFISPQKDRIVLGTRTTASDGTRVAICLFGSKDNLPSFVGPEDASPGGWSSSAMWEIEGWLASRCSESGLSHSDPESLSVEAMKIAFEQGTNINYQDNPDKPWVRGYTFGDSPEAEWFAEIYSDVRLDQDRWSLDEPVDRILVGAPLWIRTPRTHFRRYRDLRRGFNQRGIES